MGRPIKPNDAKIRDGDRKDRINKDEPQSPRGLPEPPDWLDAMEQGAYRDLATRLVEMKLDRRADETALIVFAVNYRIWRECIDAVRGCLEVTTGLGSSKAHPLLQQMNQAQATMTGILKQFGFTPAARAALRLEQNNSEAFMKMLNNVPR